jgi:uncharacterized protein
MKRAKNVVVDVDAHYYESPRSFAKYLDEPWKTRIANWSGQNYTPGNDGPGSNDTGMGGRIDRGKLVGGHPFYQKTREGVLESMKALGVDVSVLFPGSMLSIGDVPDRNRAVALCKGYVEHMIDEVVSPEEGIFTILVAPAQDPPQAAELIEKVGHQDGVCGVAMIPSGLPIPFGDPHYDPIYEATVKQGLPLVIHSINGPAFSMFSPGLQSFQENHLGFVMNNMRQMTNIVFQGLPERFPELKIIFEESGVFWIPEIMFYLDGLHARFRSYNPILKKPPSEYIKGFYFGTQPLEQVPRLEYLKHVFDMIDGPKRLMFATDWPHADFDMPIVIRRMGFLSEEEKSRILGANAMEVFRFRGFPN